MKKELPYLFLLFSLMANALFAQQTPIKQPSGRIISAASIDSIINNLMGSADVTGLHLAIVNNNTVAYVKSYGYKNKATGGLNDTATSLYAASLAKPLFAHIVMQLVDAGKLNLDKPIYTYLPNPLPDYDDYKDLAGDDRWKLITARMCLSHTTGFPNWRQLFPPDYKLKILFTPGSRYYYSGEGLYLLQLVVETITGRRLEELAQQNIFKPFGMPHSSFLWQPAFDKNYGVGHNMSEDTLAIGRPVKENAAGSMQTTIADYARFMAAVMQRKRLLEKAWNEMFTPQINISSKRQFSSLEEDTTTDNNSIQLAYGLGWGLFTSAYGKAFFKEGHGWGWQHYTISIPGKKYALVIMTNSDNGESIFKALVEKITGITIPWYWEGYTPYRPAVKLPAQVLQQFTGEYTGKLTAIVTLVNGILKVESPTVNLAKTNLYAINDHHFFLKIMDTEIDFVKGADGKIEKAVLDDEGDHYELTKVK